MEFRILGPLQATAGPTEATLARRERVLLALLLLHTNQPVSVERISEAIWGQRQPRKAAGQVQGAVYRLRKQLTMAGIPEAVILTDTAGYRTQIDPDALDLTRFRQLRDRARTTAAGGEPEQAAAQYRAGLDLWRGSALAGIDSDLLQQAAAALDEEHLQAWQECLETELTLGQTGELVAELTDVVGQHPHREGLHRLLMLALYRAGRQADALAVYRHARKLLRDDLGIDPGPELQRLHQAVLNRDPDLDDYQRRPTATTARLIPRELPADVAGFTGRTDELGTLDEMLATSSQDQPTPVVISAIAGTAGVGKTALAVHWAHQVAHRFPEGQLYQNLRGYDPDRPVAPADALARLLTSLGVAGREVPLELQDRAARYRSEVAGRRLLIVLDNAATADQVRLLLPGSGSCTVVVTSRDSLAGLVAIDGAHRLVLDQLPPDDAVVLLRRLIGARVHAEPDATAELVKLCAGLPLTLRVAAELAASRPGVPLAELVAELSDRQRRLELLDAGGDPHAAVTAVFSWSVRHLPPQALRMFRLLGLHPGPDFDPYTTAALADTSLDDAHGTLDLLARAHLLHATGPGRYGMHDVLRTYAAALAADQDPDAERRAALSRLLDYYLATAAAAMDAWFPAELHRRPRVKAAAKYIPDVSDSGSAASWLDAERQCLVAVAAYTAAAGWPEIAMHLSETLYRYLNGGHYGDSLAVHGHALGAAQIVGDLAGQASALRMLGNTHERMSRYDSALAHLREALALFRQIDDHTGQALTLNNIGGVEWKLGRFDSATLHDEQALALFRQVGDPIGEASTLTSLGNVEQVLGRYQPAADHLERSRALFHELGHTQGEAHALNSLGGAEERLGRYQSAVMRYERALVLFRKVGSRRGEAAVLDSLGTVLTRLGDLERATEHFHQAFIQFREIGEKEGESWALNGLGEAARTAGRFGDALAHHTDALASATDTGSRDQQARAHTGIGRAHSDLGNAALARTHYDHALALYTDLGMPDAEEVRVYLHGLETNCDR